MSTNYKQLVGSTDYDLNTIFLSKSANAADATNFTNSDGKDLNQLFEKLSNQPCNFTVNYGFADKFQSRYFTPKATVGTTIGRNSATLNFTSAAFNNLAITGSTTGNITGVSGTSSYSYSLIGLLPDSNYSYTCTPSNSGTSPDASTTKVNGTVSTVNINTLPLVKGASVTVASYSSLTISWGATNQSDCSYNYVKVGRSTTSGGEQTLLALASSTNIPNTTYSLTDAGLTQGTTYYYTITPYNTSNEAGTAISSNNTTPRNTTINSFSFSSVIGTSSDGGYIRFNVNISNCSSASIKDNNSQSTAVDITLTNNAYNNTISVPFTTGYGTFTLTAKGGTADKTATVTFSYGNRTYTSSDSNYSGYVFWRNCNVIGGGGGGGGGGSNGNSAGGGGGGGGGGAGGNSRGGSSFEASSSDTINITIVIGDGGNGGGNTNDGEGGTGDTGGTSSLRIILANQKVDNTVSATGGTGGAGGKKNDAAGAGGGIGIPNPGDTSISHAGSSANKGAAGEGGPGYILYYNGSGSYGAGGRGGGSEFFSGGNYGRNYSEPGSRGANGYVTATVYYISGIS
jgi:hypothetical protein